MRVDEHHRRTVLISRHRMPTVLTHMGSLRQGLWRQFPAHTTPLRWLELARIGQMQSRTSLFRFVREHLMRHAETGRENLPVESGLLPDPFARVFFRSC